MKSFALMQPHFIPYIGYFYLIFCADVFVYYDTAQFSHQSWQCRNRIRDQAGVVHMVSVPVCRSSRFLPISEVLMSRGKFNDLDQSFKELTNRIECYYRKAPYISALSEFLSRAFQEPISLNLINLNIHIIRLACSELSLRIGRSPDFQLFSKVMESIPGFMELERVERIAICASMLKCDQYYTPVGSVEYMLSSPYMQKLHTLRTSVLLGNSIRYHQIGAKGRAFPGFEGNLSILDLIANIGWDGVAELLLSHGLFEIRDISSFQSPA